MKRRAASVGVVTGVATAAAAAVLANTVRCIDTAVFYYPPALIWASLGVAAGAAMVPAPAGRRIAIPLLIVGIVLLAIALVGPPYRTCAQFDFFR
jgi:peptidoglycan/LPS O-acetylase OafA/YrhL